MNKKQSKIIWLIEQIDIIIERAIQLEQNFKDQIKRVHPKFEEGARNLVHYRALRMEDIHEMQKKLGNLGLSRLAKSESHVMASLLATKSILEGFLEQASFERHPVELLFKESRRQEKYNSKSLLGYRSKGRRTRIMVTLPTAAAQDYQLVHDMIASGMNCARINCAHDDTIVWEQMITHIRTASKALKQKCKIAMDLGGPKIRTGALTPGPKIKKFRPKKNAHGKIIEPCVIWLGKEPLLDSGLLHLPMEWEVQPDFLEGQQISFKDARTKKRKFTIVETRADGCIVKLYKTCYLETGMKLFVDKGKTEPITVGELPPLEHPIILHTNDLLIIDKAYTLGANAQLSDDGLIKHPAHISCTLPSILQQIKKGEPIFFDDGKIEGVIREVKKEFAIIEIVHAKASGAKLRADKGINLPHSELSISGLTTKDKKDLQFVVQHADVVNLSFVNTVQDVKDLLVELKQLNASKSLGIILKIETQSGFNQLTEILLEAMQVHPLGVMIARGDLAIECGWENIGRIQEEILALCQGARVPVVWATQVLESLSKQGTPSRAEITDAAMAQRADGVMLNKGPFILQSINLLDSILTDLAPYQEKNAQLLPKLVMADKNL